MAELEAHKNYLITLPLDHEDYPTCKGSARFIRELLELEYEQIIGGEEDAELQVQSDD